MKNKKSLLSLGLVALVLVLGVGYAVVSSVGLTFGGSATVAETILNVDIESVTHNAPDGVTVVDAVEQHSKTANFTITGMKLNDEVTITYTVNNHEKDVDAKLTGSTLQGNNEYFTASYVISNDGELARNGTATVTVTVEMVKTPVDTDGKANFTFTLEAAPVQ